MKTLKFIPVVLGLAFCMSACNSKPSEPTEEVISEEEQIEVHQLDSVSAEITNESQDLENTADEILKGLE